MGLDRKIRVAIVGSGMSGLATAWLLHHDQRKRYEVVLFESGESLSLDSASITVSNPANGKVERVDLPMRAFAGGFYENLRAMYDYLGIGYREQPFIFRFEYTMLGKDGTKESKPYFVHASNNHILPPIRPQSYSLVTYVIEVLYVLVCYAWFTLCCFCVAPIQSAGDLSQSQGLCESLDAYLGRIRLPDHFVSFYLLPLLSSVATCSYDALRTFPASDLTQYKRRTHGAPHFTVVNGVHQVQERLSDGLNIRLRAKVTKVELATIGAIAVTWFDTAMGLFRNERFDKVVLAVSPNIVKAIHEPLCIPMARLTTVEVESVVHVAQKKSLQRHGSEGKETENATTKAQNIFLRTEEGSISRTESIHEQMPGILVTTCPSSVIPESHILQRSKFTRVLRTPESKQIVNTIFNHLSRPKFERQKLPHSWRNGDDGVYLVGGWCWDGMVLSEGCIVSAMRVANALDVEIPWKTS